MIVIVASIKGGTGKTTIATNLSIIRAKNASDVLLIDADTQGSASDFAAVRGQLGHIPEITLSSLVGSHAGAEIRKLEAKFDDIIVDVGGRDTSTLRSSLLIADTLVVPFLPSQLDAWALEHMDELVEEILQFNNKLRVFAFLNKIDTNPRIGLPEEASALAAEFKHLNIAKVTVGQRIAFRRAIAEGMSVTELKHKDVKAIQEMDNLYKEVFRDA